MTGLHPCCTCTLRAARCNATRCTRRRRLSPSPPSALTSTQRRAQALEFLLCAALALESSIVLLGARYVAWRTRIYAAICFCFEAAGGADEALKFAKRALGQVGATTGHRGRALAQATRRPNKRAASSRLQPVLATVCANGPLRAHAVAELSDQRAGRDRGDRSRAGAARDHRRDRRRAATNQDPLGQVPRAHARRRTRACARTHTDAGTVRWQRRRRRRSTTRPRAPSSERWSRRSRARRARGCGRSRRRRRRRSSLRSSRRHTHARTRMHTRARARACTQLIVQARARTA
jgi:hypothetical protein